MAAAGNNHEFRIGNLVVNEPLFGHRGDVIEFNMTTGTVLNKTSGKTLQAQPLSDYVMNILASGGIKPLIKKQMEG